MIVIKNINSGWRFIQKNVKKPAKIVDLYNRFSDFTR